MLTSFVTGRTGAAGDPRRTTSSTAPGSRPTSPSTACWPTCCGTAARAATRSAASTSSGTSRSRAPAAATGRSTPRARPRWAATSPAWTRSSGCRWRRRRSPTTWPGTASAADRSGALDHPVAQMGLQPETVVTMVPTLWGRMQTRIFLLATVGARRHRAHHAGAAGRRATVGPVPDNVHRPGHGRRAGLGWEFVYHFLMQFRWEKDWPSMFGLLTAVPEGAAGLAATSPGCRTRAADGVPTLAFAIHFVTVWLCVWLVANGPMRVPFIRWRFRGGRLA